MESSKPSRDPERAGRIQIAGEHVGILGKVEFAQASAWPRSVIRRYCREEIDSVYVVFNEFKSVIAQRLIVEQILPIEQIGSRRSGSAEELTEEEKKKAKEAAVSAGVGMRATEGAERKRHTVRKLAGRLHLRAAARRTVPRAAAEVCEHSDFPSAAGVGGRRACGTYDRDGFRYQQRDRHDRFADAGHEPGAAGEDHERDHRDRQRRGGNVEEAISSWL